jgi:glutathione peroxidase
MAAIPCYTRGSASEGFRNRTTFAKSEEYKVAKSIYDIKVKTIDGAEQTLETYRGKVLLIVNVASRCGFTPQYSGLENLWKEYRNKGLVVLGFPCNQFGAQEPASDAEIKSFCSTTYDVTFPMFSKVDVNGEAAHELFKFLRAAAPGAGETDAIRWNFGKFVVSKDGTTVTRFAPDRSPEQLAQDLAAFL